MLLVSNKIKVFSERPSKGITCEGEFKRGASNRLCHPLASGMAKNKLQEALRDIKAYREEIDLLSSKLRNKEQLLGLHTYGDHIPWIKKMPLEIAYEFGWKVLPAIIILEDSGVDRKTLSYELPYFKNQIDNLIEDCEITYQSLKGPIAKEYDRWRSGYSTLDDILIAAEKIINDASSLIPVQEVD
jgi:hypothetical protein